MKNLFSIILLFYSFACIAQNQQANLEKYWRYRDRLRNNFVVVNPNVEKPGVNYPMGSTYNFGTTGGGKMIKTDDGNQNLNHYISVLATEYWLLKRNGHNTDLTVTVQELTYALLALERLICYSNMQMRKATPGFVNPSYLVGDIETGFFMRDDFSASFFCEYSSHFFKHPFVEQNADIPCGFKYSFTSNFEHNIETQPSCRPQHKDISGVCDNCLADQGWTLPLGYTGMSIDNVANMWRGLALVKKLVDNNVPIQFPIFWAVDSKIEPYLINKNIFTNNAQINFKIWATDLVDRMESFIKSNAYVIAPDPLSVIQSTKKPFWDALILQGHIAADIIYGPKLNSINVGDIINPVWDTRVILGSNRDLSITPSYHGLIKARKWFDDSFPLTIDPLYEFIFKFALLAQEFKDKSSNFIFTLAAIGNVHPTPLINLYDLCISTNYDYIAFLYEILQDDYRVDDDLWAKTINLLNAAPKYGIRSWNPVNNADKSAEDPLYYSSLWTGNTLADPTAQNNPGNESEYGGLDYMLLHNLFYIVCANHSGGSLELNNKLYYSSGHTIKSKKITFNPGFKTKYLTPAYFDIDDEYYTLSAIFTPLYLLDDKLLGKCQILSQDPVKLNFKAYNLYNASSYSKISVTQCTDPLFLAVVTQNQTNDVPVYAPSHAYIEYISDILTYQFSNDITDCSNPSSYLASPPSIKSLKDSIKTNTLITLNNQVHFGIYPNPFNSIFYIIDDVSSISIEITNSSGIVVYDNIISSNNTAIDFSNHPSGIYFIKATYNNDSKIVKLVKQ